MSIETKIRQDVPLAPLTTFRLGGPAKFFLEIATKKDLEQAYVWAEKNQQTIFILGGGSNILINDNGVDGLVIKFVNTEINVRSQRLECGAGANLIRACRIAAGESLSGLEWASGIPGATIGGAVRGNAGAYGASISDCVETVEVFNKIKKKFFVFSHNDCKFVYRGSIFKYTEDYFIWNAVLKLVPGLSSEINSKMSKYLEQREKSQPKSPSAGSVFKNISFVELEKFNEHVANEAKKKGVVKDDMIPAGWLIEHMGLKGKAIGGAKVSLEHSNFIINTGKATTEDVMMLISYIKQQIRTKLKIQLQEEVQYLGF